MLFGALLILWGVILFMLCRWWEWGEEEIEDYHIWLTVGVIALFFILRLVFFIME